MPLYHFQCPTCGPVKRLLDLDAGERVRLPCKRCGAAMTRVPQGASTNVVERIDSGLQYRATERPADAQRIFKEREIAHDQEYGDGRISDEDLVPIDDDGDPV